jgi:adenosylcobinamide-phosphate synthase
LAALVMAVRRAAVLVSALAVDLAFGEPPNAVHPVVWMGKAIGWLERRAPGGCPLGQLAYGAIASAAVIGGSGAFAVLVPRTIQPAPVQFVVEVLLLKSTFAVRSLLEASEAVRLQLDHDDLDAARSALRSLVSRDPRQLSAALVAAAAIESLAENLTDSALAPWLTYAVFGLPGAFAYRALNTLDSMIGYHGRYEYLGKAAARTDDVANLLPARLGAVLIAGAAPAGSGNARRALRTAVSYHGRTSSPNAGWTMGAMAGALDLTLEKPGAYRLGTGRPPVAGDIRRAQRIAAAALAGGALAATALTSWASRTRRRI